MRRSYLTIAGLSCVLLVTAIRALPLRTGERTAVAPCALLSTAQPEDSWGHNPSHLDYAFHKYDDPKSRELHVQSTVPGLLVEIRSHYDPRARENDDSFFAQDKLNVVNDAVQNCCPGERGYARRFGMRLDNQALAPQEGFWSAGHARVFPLAAISASLRAGVPRS